MERRNWLRTAPRFVTLREGVAVFAIVALAAGCGRDEQLTTPPADTVAAVPQPAAPLPGAATQPPAPQIPAPAQQPNAAQPAVQQPAAQYDDIYRNMTPEQRAALGLNNATPEQIAAVTQAAQQPAQQPAGSTPALTDEQVEDAAAFGQINMEEIQAAFEQATDIEDFEVRINRIYEGAHVLLVNVENQAPQVVTEAWEDLDDTGVIDRTADDLLFALTVESQTRAARLEGRGANAYYSHAYPPAYTPTGGFWAGYLLGTAMARPQYVYVTPPPRRAVIHNEVVVYRATPAWVAHRQAQRAYYERWRAHPRWVAPAAVITPARHRWRASRPPVVVTPAPRPSVGVYPAPRPPAVVVHPAPRPPAVVVRPAPRPPAVVVRPAPRPPAVVVRPAPRPGPVVVRPAPRPGPVVVRPAPRPGPVVVRPAPRPGPVVVRPAPRPGPVVVRPAPRPPHPGPRPGRR
jgi:hypothetical protein